VPSDASSPSSRNSGPSQRPARDPRLRARWWKNSTQTEIAVATTALRAAIHEPTQPRASSTAYRNSASAHTQRGASSSR
jgi:hypothetical protein